MKNDARFFFCFAGFVGFLLFYITTSLLNRNLAFSLMHGAIGCLSFAIYGRFLLGILLKHATDTPSSSNPVSNSAGKNLDEQANILQPKPKPISRNQTPKVSSINQPMVDAKV